MDSRRRQVLVALCVTEIVSYGVLYYAFAILAPTIAQQTGWTQFEVTAAFSAGNLLGAICGIPVGRILQRRGPRLVMTVGALVATTGMVGVAVAPNLIGYFVAWLVVGAGTSCVFYPPAFAALTAWFADKRVKAITTLTLAAGFASTIFAPLTGILNDQLGWRGTYLLLALVLLLVTVPLHAVALRLPWPKPATRKSVAVRQEVRSRSFVMLSVAGTLTALVSYASLVSLPFLLIDRGFSPAFAAGAVGAAGAAQVAGRLVYPMMSGRMKPRHQAAGVVAVLAVAVACQAFPGEPAGLLVVLVAVSGAMRGLFTLVSATLVADLWGPAKYASLSGVYNAPLSAMGALAPGIGAGVAFLLGSYSGLFVVLGIVGVAGAIVAVVATEPFVARDPLQPASPEAGNTPRTSKTAAPG